MAVLIVVLLWILWKERLKGEAIAFGLSMIAVSIWFVPWCLAYTYSFLCMLVTTIIGTQLALARKGQWLGPVFMVAGMVTVYFDSLTTEGLSLLIPLLFIMRIEQKRKAGKQILLRALKYAMAWGIGYIGMWTMKWFLASSILHLDVMPYVQRYILGMINTRVVGYYVTGNFYTDALAKNFLRLFPLEYGIAGAILIFTLIFGLIVLPVVLGKVVLRKEIQGQRIALYLLLGLVPYARYLVLASHSYANFFYTFRAQAATVLAVCFIMLELVERVKTRQPG